MQKLLERQSAQTVYHAAKGMGVQFAEEGDKAGCIKQLTDILRN